MGYKDKQKQKEYQAAHFQRNKEKVVKRTKDKRYKTSKWFYEYKCSKKCERCSFNHPDCLEFHHKDPTIKKYEVGFMVNYGWSVELILQEIAKCEILCANCHRIEHANKGFRRYRMKEEQTAVN